jgi:hypothetical protein
VNTYTPPPAMAVQLSWKSQQAVVVQCFRALFLLRLPDKVLSGPRLISSKQMLGKVISITYLGVGSIHEEIGRILRRIERWHQGPVTSYRILYQDAPGLGGEIKWDGENAELIAPR